MTTRTITKVQAQKLVGTQGMERLIKAGQSTPAGTGLQVVVVMQGGKLVYCLEGPRADIEAILEQIKPRRPMTQVALKRYHRTGVAAHMAQ